MWMPRVVSKGFIFFLFSALSVVISAADWELSSYTLYRGDFGLDADEDIYLEAKPVPRSAQIPYNISVDYQTDSEIKNVVLESDGSGNYLLQYDPSPAQLGAVSWQPAAHISHFGDFNGDGFEDVLLQAQTPGQTSVIVLGFSEGGQPSIFQQFKNSELGVELADPSATLTIQDLNSDGKSDILVTRVGFDDIALYSSGQALNTGVDYPSCSTPEGPDTDCDGVADRYDAFANNAAEQSDFDGDGIGDNTDVDIDNDGILNSSDSYDTDINNGIAIGAISADFSVNSTGKVNYNIPLNLIPSIGGIAPGLSLSYDQGAGNGLVGMGWYISGLSEISRCPTTITQDSYINGVNFNSSDKYCLNGQRLVSIGAGQYGANGTEYRTENETFSKIISYGSSGNGPSYFKVWKPSGEIETYGDTSASRRLTQGATSHVLTWAINKIEDREGNYANYEYHNDNALGAFYVTRINYTGNDFEALSPNNSVRFSYVSRSDNEVSYANSTLTQLPVRLSKITTHLGVSDTPVRTYHLNYITGTNGRSLLKDVKECLVSNQSCLPITDFTWDLGAPNESKLVFGQSESNTSFSADSFSNHQYHLGDVNSDGKSDIIWTYRETNKLGRVLFQAKANGDGFTQKPLGEDAGYLASVSDDADQKYLMGDINGDGKSDLVWTARHLDTLVYSTYLANSSGDGFTSQGYEVDYDLNYGNVLQGEHHLADVNGDNRTDLLWIYHYNNKLGINVYQARSGTGGKVGLGKVSSFIDQDLSPDFYENQQYLTGDVNGDGKSDLVWLFTFQNKFYRVLYLANAGGTGFTKISLQEDSYATPYTNIQYVLGDINSDGKSDLVWTYNNQNKLGRTVYLASRLGTSFVEKSENTGVVVGGFNPNNHISPRSQLTDINGDDKLDWVYSYIENGDFGWITNLANLDGEDFTQIDSGSRTGPTGSDNHEYRFADVTGDGKSDLVWTYNLNNTLNRVTFTQPQSYPDHISGITNGLNEAVNIQYTYLAGSSIYTSGGAADYPLRNDNGLSYVVSQVERSDGLGGLNSWNYSYQGARTHLQGRGFLGFTHKTVINNQSGFKTQENYLQDFPYTGLLSNVVIRKSNNDLVEQSYNHWKQTPLNGGKTSFRYLNDQSTVKYNLTDTNETFSSVALNEYDINYGNRTKNTVVTGTGFTGAIAGSFNVAGNFAQTDISNIEQQTIVDNTYINTPANWRIGFLASEATTYHVPDIAAADQIVKKLFTPYSSNSFTTLSETDFVDTDITQTRTYTRDGFGNVTQRVISGDDIDAGNIAPQNESINQYIEGIYPDTVTNHFGHTEKVEYDHRYGTEKKRTDANGLVTDAQTDGFGRVVYQRGQDGTETRILYQNCTALSDCPTYASYGVTTKVTHPSAQGFLGQPTKVSYFDILNREVAEKTLGFDGTNIWVDTNYDNRSRIAGQTLPYYQGDTKHWTTYQYDDLDLVTQEERPDGGITATQYLSDSSYATHNIITNTVIIPGSGNNSITTHLYQNTLGNLLKSVDGESIETELKYNAQGEVRWVRVDGNTATDVNISYDEAGNRTSLSDPDAGLIQYQYDSVGNSRRQTFDGPTDHTITSHYDELGRRTSRVDFDATTTTNSTWEYDTAINGKGLLYQTTGPDYEKTNQYDLLSRVNSSDTKLFGEATPKQFQYAYDSFSRPLITLYPSGLAINAVYNPNGYQRGVSNTDTGEDYWVAQAADAFSNITQSSFANGIITQKQYDPETGRIQTLQTGTATTTNLYQQLSYIHDSAGNLRTRHSTQNSTENLTESFAYDDIHRVLSAATTGLGGGSRSLTYGYDNLGNIKTKSDASNVNGYSYGSNGGGVHAVSSVTLSSTTTQYHYDFKGNMVTRGDYTLDYSVFNKPTKIQNSATETRFNYGPDRKRFYQYTNNNTRITETHYYDGIYEVVQEGDQVREKSYIGDFLVHTLTRREGSPASQVDIDYLHRDHLESIDIITNASGALSERMSFGPFGSRREGAWENSGAGYLTSLPDVTFASTTRGYTGHEQLDAVGLIHMNGRVYDPALGRFLSTDDFVQFPENSQSYNRYTYVMNNPLSYSDPSGELIPFLIYGAVAAYKAYNVVDTTISVSSDVVDTLDSTKSTKERVTSGLSAAVEIGGAALSIPKPLRNFGKKVASKFKTKPSNKNAKTTDNAKPEGGNGSDKNTDKPPETRGEGIPLKNNSARKLLQSRGADRSQARRTVDSFDGQIVANQGKKGDGFIITEGKVGKPASGRFVTRKSAGNTPEERRKNLALPEDNPADIERKVVLGSDQVLLEGKVASQVGNDGFPKTAIGGGRQTVTNGDVIRTD